MSLSLDGDTEDHPVKSNHASLSQQELGYLRGCRVLADALVIILPTCIDSYHAILVLTYGYPDSSSFNFDLGGFLFPNYKRTRQADVNGRKDAVFVVIRSR